MSPCSTLRLPAVPLPVVRTRPAPRTKGALPAAWRRLPRPLPARGTQAKHWGAARRSAPGALRPDAHFRKRHPVSRSQCRANPAPHSRARVLGARRPLSCKRQGENGAPATPLAMPPFPTSWCKETRPGWTHQGQCRQEDCLADLAWARGAASPCKQLKVLNGKRTWVDPSPNKTYKWSTST